MASQKQNSNSLYFLLIVALTIGVLFSSFASEEKEPYYFPKDPLKGSKLFVSKGCVKCHTIWGIGDFLGPDLAQISREKTLLQLAGLLWSHSPKMIEIMQERGVSLPSFTPQEMGDLMGYIYYFNYFDRPGDLIEGEKLFQEKGCSSCHSVGEDSVKNKISLDEYGKYISPSFLVTGLWNHSPEILSGMKRMGIKQPEFKGRELSHLLAYVRGAALNQKGEVVYAEPGSPKKGKDIFKQKKCNGCHAIWGEGGKRASDLGKRELRVSLTEIAGKIWSHSDQMWNEMKRMGIPFPVFSPKEMADLISYLYFIQFYDERGDFKQGKELFRKKVCIFCHSLEGAGKNVGPDLTQSRAQFSPIYLASSMWNHAVVMKDMLEEMELPYPRFSGDEMRDLVTYIQKVTQESREEKARGEVVPSESKVLFISENRFDPELARQGKKIYTSKACNACHTMTGEMHAAMGGDLKDITKKRDLEWLFRFIKDPKAMLKTDGLARQLLREFNNIPMPQQGLTDEEAMAIIEYLKAPEKIE